MGLPIKSLAMRLANLTVFAFMLVPSLIFSWRIDLTISALFQPSGTLPDIEILKMRLPECRSTQDFSGKPLELNMSIYESQTARKRSVAVIVTICDQTPLPADALRSYA